MKLFNKPKKQWNIAYYQENLVSPFKFEYAEGNSEDMENPFDNMDERRQRLRIFTLSKIDFSKDDKIYVNNHGYLLEFVEPKALKEYLNRPYLASQQLGKELVLVY